MKVECKTNRVAMTRYFFFYDYYQILIGTYDLNRKNMLFSCSAAFWLFNNITTTITCYSVPSSKKTLKYTYTEREIHLMLIEFCI